MRKRKNPVIDMRLEFLKNQVVHLLKIDGSTVISLKGKLSKLNNASWNFDPEGKYRGGISFSPSNIKEINFKGTCPTIILN